MDIPDDDDSTNQDEEDFIEHFQHIEHKSPLCVAGYGLNSDGQKCAPCDEGMVQPYNNTSRACRPYHRVNCPVEDSIPGNRTHDPRCKREMESIQIIIVNGHNNGKVYLQS